jgi:hypothetical protein
VLVGVAVAVLVDVSVGVAVGVGAVTVSTVLALVEDAFVAKAFTVFVKVAKVAEFADAVTVIVADALIARSESLTSKLDGVKLTVPLVAVTLLMVSQVGKSLSVMSVPRARYVPVFLTVMVYVTGLRPTPICAGVTLLVRFRVVDGTNGQLSVSLL